MFLLKKAFIISLGIFLSLSLGGCSIGNSIKESIDNKVSIFFSHKSEGDKDDEEIKDILNKITKDSEQKEEATLKDTENDNDNKDSEKIEVEGNTNKDKIENSEDEEKVVERDNSNDKNEIKEYVENNDKQIENKYTEYVDPEYVVKMQYEEADKQLNEIWKQLKIEGKITDSLLNSELEWIKYKDNLSSYNEKLRATQERIYYLNSFR